MRILNKQEVDQKAIEYAAPLSMLAVEVKYIETNFLSGVLYAESKISEIAIEFFIWTQTSDVSNRKLKYGLPQIGKNFNLNLYVKELFELFLKERNNND